MFTNIPTENKNLPEDMVLNLIIAYLNSLLNTRDNLQKE